MSLPTIELMPAFYWICQECGRDNFAPALVLDREELEEHDPEAAELVQELGMGGGAGVFYAPTDVICVHCKTAYDVAE